MFSLAEALYKLPAVATDWQSVHPRYLIDIGPGSPGPRGTREYRVYVTLKYALLSLCVTLLLSSYVQRASFELDWAMFGLILQLSCIHVFVGPLTSRYQIYNRGPSFFKRMNLVTLSQVEKCNKIGSVQPIVVETVRSVQQTVGPNAKHHCSLLEIDAQFFAMYGSGVY
jgi:hypothetical protein